MRSSSFVVEVQPVPRQGHALRLFHSISDINQYYSFNVRSRTVLFPEPSWQNKRKKEKLCLAVLATVEVKVNLADVWGFTKAEVIHRRYATT